MVLVRLSRSAGLGKRAACLYLKLGATEIDDMAEDQGALEPALCRQGEVGMFGTSYGGCIGRR